MGYSKTLRGSQHMNYKQQKVLVTGGAGYIGSVLVPMLINLGYDVTVIDNLMYNQTSIFTQAESFTFIYGDVTDSDFMDEYIRMADIIIPLAGIVGMPACKKFPVLASSVNYDHVSNCARKKRESTKLIFPNTNSGYGVGEFENDELKYCDESTPLNPISTYGESKVDAEVEVLRSGGVAFRLATVFGLSPRMRIDLLVNDFVYRAVTDGYIVLFESHFKRNYIHIKDVCRAFIFAIDNYSSMQSQTFNLGLSNANLSKMELCEKIQEQLPTFFVTESNLQEDPDKRNYIVSNKKLEGLGFNTVVSLEDGIKELINGYKFLVHTHGTYTNQ